MFVYVVVHLNVWRGLSHRVLIVSSPDTLLADYDLNCLIEPAVGRELLVSVENLTARRRFYVDRAVATNTFSIQAKYKKALLNRREVGSVVFV